MGVGKSWITWAGGNRSSAGWSITLSVNGTPVEFKIDTGADVPVIPTSILQGLPDTALKPATKVLSCASSKTLKQLSSTKAEATEEVYAIGKLNRSLLGRPAIEALGLVQRVNAVQTQLDIEKQFPKPFRGLGKMEEEYKIVLQEGARPYTLSTPRRITIPLLSQGRAIWNAWNAWES